MKMLRFCFVHGALATFDHYVPDDFDFLHFRACFEEQGSYAFGTSVVFSHAVQAVLMLDEKDLAQQQKLMHAEGSG